MSAEPAKKRFWRRDRPVKNPYRDTLRQEIGYKIDSRTASCLTFVILLAVFAVAGLSFIVYWLTH